MTSGCRGPTWAERSGKAISSFYTSPRLRLAMSYRGRNFFVHVVVGGLVGLLPNPRWACFVALVSLAALTLEISEWGHGQRGLERRKKG